MVYATQEKPKQNQGKDPGERNKFRGRDTGRNPENKERSYGEKT